MDRFAAVLRDRLLATQNRDGGWGYYAGKRSRLEPTSQAIIALRSAGQTLDAAVLGHWPARDGLLIDADAAAPNIAFHAQALLAVRAVNEPVIADPLRRALVAAKGRTYPQMAGLPQDNSLEGWSWRRGTISWVEPTAWSLLALKVWRDVAQPAVEERIRVGEELLDDRMCQGGGWNYGNSMVFNHALPPHVTVTALGLLALADTPASHAAKVSLGFLSSHRLAERSASALALSLMCLREYGVPADDVEPALRSQWQHTRYMDNSVGIALALSAVTDSSIYRVVRA